MSTCSPLEPVNVTSFGKRGFSDVMRFNCSRSDLGLPGWTLNGMAGVFIKNTHRKVTEEEKPQEDSHGHSAARSKGMPIAPELGERGKKGFYPGAFRHLADCPADTLISDFSLSDMTE